MFTHPLIRIEKAKISPRKLLFFLFCGATFSMPLGTSPFTILGIALLSVWIFSGQFLTIRERLLKVPWVFPVSAMIVLSWIGLFWSTDPGGLGLDYAKKTHYWLYALALATIQLPEGKKDALIKAFLIGLVLNSLAAFLQVAEMIPKFGKWGSTRYTGFSSGYNTLGILLVLGAAMASYYFGRSETKKEKTIHAILFASYLGHLMILESRGGYLVFALVSPVIVYNFLRGRGLFVMIIAYALFLALMVSSPIVRHRIAQTKESIKNLFHAGSEVMTGKKYSESLDRVYMWRWAIGLFMKHPLCGVGTGGYSKAILEEGGERGIDHPHSNVLHVAVSYGLLGLFVFGWFFWVLLREGFRQRHLASGFFVLAATLVVLIGGLTDTHVLDAGGASLLAITTGLVGCKRKTSMKG